jgi:ribosomal protein L37AE/L43A
MESEIMSEWKQIGNGTEIFECKNCKEEKNVRINTKKVRCKKCGCVFERI